VQFPEDHRGVVPVGNIGACRPTAGTLRGPPWLDIYLGDISTWNDPRSGGSIRSSRSPTPRSPLCPVFPMASGPLLFSDYLSKSSPRLQQTVGANTLVAMAGGDQGQGTMASPTYPPIPMAPSAMSNYVLRPPKQTHMAYCALIQGGQYSRAQRNLQAAAVAPTGPLHVLIT